jgi:predicted Zn-dependent protease
MFSGKRKMQLAAALSACAIALPGSFALAPAPVADAGFLDADNIAIAVLGGVAYSAQVNQEIKKYNDTEEGRNELFQEMQKKYGVNEDPALNARLRGIMTNLTNAIASVDDSINQKPYQYFINNEKSFNAFCTLGHNMSVNTGLFDVLTSDDEIAVVLGHEMGHGQKDHPAKSARKSIGPAVLATATGGSFLGNLAANAWNNQGITKPQEKEADALAFEYITHSDYNPGATAAIWQRVMDKSKGKETPDFLYWAYGGNDHPSDSSRREAAEKRLVEYSGKHVTIDHDEGMVRVNGKDFTKPAAAGDMSAKERAYFVMGNLAAAYHNGHNQEAATVDGQTVKLGAQAIMTCGNGDEAPEVLAERLNKIK